MLLLESIKRLESIESTPRSINYQHDLCQRLKQFPIRQTGNTMPRGGTLLENSYTPSD